MTSIVTTMHSLNIPTTPSAFCPYGWMCPHIRLCRETSEHKSPLPRELACKIISRYTDEEAEHIVAHMLQGDPLRSVPIAAARDKVARFLPIYDAEIPKTDYSKHFLRGGHHAHADLVIDANHQVTLRNSRGVFFKNIPAGTKLRDITASLRGGAIERIDFHPDSNKHTAGIYFILAADAARYIRETRRILGHWAVDAIPRHKGGHETIKLNVGSGIFSEGATRVIRVSRLPPMWSVKEIERVVRGQSNTVRVEIEDIKAVGFDTVEIAMASIGTALGARLNMGKQPRFYNCVYDFVRDPCESPLSPLLLQWRRRIAREGNQLRETKAQIQVQGAVVNGKGSLKMPLRHHILARN